MEELTDVGRGDYERTDCERTLQTKDIKIREIQISQLDRGYAVRVGCKAFAIERKERLLSLLHDYIDNPTVTEKRYFDNELF